MKVNIGIPVYNAGKTLGRVLENTLGQFPFRDRIIVVDDGSTDLSASIALRREVRVISHLRNRGLASARNTILKHSDCDFLIYFDGDASPAPGCIDEILKPFSDPEVVAVGGCGVEVNCKTMSSKWRARNTPQSHGDSQIENDWMVMGLCMAFRRTALTEIGGFDSKFRTAGEDVDISIRLRNAGGKLIYNPKARVDHLPEGDLFDITFQAFKHAKYASYALLKNNLAPNDYAMDSARCLAYASAKDLKEGRIAQVGIGAINFAARAAGIAAGAIKASTEKRKRK